MTDMQQFALRKLAYYHEQMQRYGEPGTAIPGSVYYRSYCHACKSAMRVTYENRIGIHFCGCSNHPIGGIPGPPEDESPWGSNAVRALEGD